MQISKRRAMLLTVAGIAVTGIGYVVATSTFTFEIDTPLMKAPAAQKSDTIEPLAVLASSGPIVRRFAPDTGWTRTWVLGSDTTTDLFIEPRHVAVSGDVVAILDDGSREVQAFDTRTGAKRFKLLPLGQGPGEFKRPSQLAGTPTGFAVLDGDNARLTAYDRQGKLEWDVVLDDLATIGGVCVRPGPGISVFHQRLANNIVDYDTTGRRTAVRTMKWLPASDTTSSFSFIAYLSNTNTSGSCVVAPVFHAQWSVINATGAVRAFDYKEPGAAAAIKTQEVLLGRTATQVAIQTTSGSNSPHAARGALIIGDTAIIATAHTKEYRYRILDYHKLSTGEYLHSRLLPAIFNSLTVGDDGTFYGTIIADSRQLLIAMKPGVR